MQPTCWMCTSQEESAPHPSLELLQPREQYKDLDRPMPGMETNAQPTADHPHRMQPAASPSCFRKVVHQHTWSTTPHPKLLCISHHAAHPDPRHQDPSYRTAASYYQHPGQLKASNPRLL